MRDFSYARLYFPSQVQREKREEQQTSDAAGPCTQDQARHPPRRSCRRRPPSPPCPPCHAAHAATAHPSFHVAAHHSQADGVWERCTATEQQLCACFSLAAAGLRQLATPADLEHRMQHAAQEALAQGALAAEQAAAAAAAAAAATSEEASEEASEGHVGAAAASAVEAGAEGGEGPFLTEVAMPQTDSGVPADTAAATTAAAAAEAAAKATTAAAEAAAATAAAATAALEPLPPPSVELLEVACRLEDPENARKTQLLEHALALLAQQVRGRLGGGGGWGGGEWSGRSPRWEERGSVGGGEPAGMGGTPTPAATPHRTRTRTQVQDLSHAAKRIARSAHESMLQSSELPEPPAPPLLVAWAFPKGSASERVSIRDTFKQLTAEKAAQEKQRVLRADMALAKEAAEKAARKGRLILGKSKTAAPTPANAAPHLDAQQHSRSVPLLN